MIGSRILCEEITKETRKGVFIQMEHCKIVTIENFLDKWMGVSVLGLDWANKKGKCHIFFKLTSVSAGQHGRHCLRMNDEEEERRIETKIEVWIEWDIDGRRVIGVSWGGGGWCRLNSQYYKLDLENLKKAYIRSLLRNYKRRRNRKQCRIWTSTNIK